MKPTLELPKTIRFLNEDEIPRNNPSVLKDGKKVRLQILLKVILLD